MGRGGMSPGSNQGFGAENTSYELEKLNKKIDVLIEIFKNDKAPKYCGICDHLDNLGYYTNRSVLYPTIAKVTVQPTYCCVAFERRKK